MRSLCHAGGAYIRDVDTEVGMGKEWPARSFKSGNSIALRIPAGLGFQPNTDWVLEDRGSEYVLRQREAPKRKFNIEKVWGIGKHLDLELIRPEDRVFEHRPLSWDADYKPE